MNIPDSFSESFETILGLKKHLKFFDADPDLWSRIFFDPAYRMEKFGSEKKIRIHNTDFGHANFCKIT